MQAMVLNKAGTPLIWTDLPDRDPGKGEIRVKVTACGVCRTDLHVVDGELPDPKTPIIPGHEIVGQIDEIGSGVEGLALGERVGIPWLGHTCGVCPIAACIGKISATIRCLPDLPATAVLRQQRSPTHASLFRWARPAAMCPLPLCSAPA